MSWNIYTALFSFSWILMQVHCQLGENTPPVLWFDRDWSIKENETIGSKIAQVHGEDDQPLIFSIIHHPLYANSNPHKNIPFRIDPETGTVYLNESLQGRGGQNLHFYVAAFDGELTVKTEVNVNILNATARYNPSKANLPPFPLGGSSSFPKFPGLFPKSPSLPSPNFSHKPTSVDNNPPYIPNQPYFQQKTYPEIQPKDKNNNTVTELKPVPVEKDVIENTVTEKTEIISSTEKSTTANSSYKENVEETNELFTADEAVTSPEFTATVIPIISVGAVFLTVGIIAVVFRKKIYIGKPKDSKEDMRKDSSGTIVLREDPGLNMHEWRAPRAFSNRYEPWQNDTNHTQVSIFNLLNLPNER